MDFTLTEELRDLQGLARTVFTDLGEPARLREVETSTTRIDELLTSTVLGTGLGAVSISESAGGSGLGLDALAVVLEEQGRCGIAAPLWNAAVAARVLDRSPEHRGLVAEVVAGRSRAALALEEYGGGPESPAACAELDQGQWRITGTKAVVPEAVVADWFVVSARTGDAPALFLVGAGAPGVSLLAQETTDHSSSSDLELVATPAHLLGGDDAANWFTDALDEQRIALSALQVGVGDGAVRIAADHVSTRTQFGRALGTFQAVQHQLADAWMDVDAQRLVLAQALSDRVQVTDPPSPRLATRSALVSAWWAAEAGLDVVHRTQHVHGGLGVDVDHPAHRHYLMARQTATLLGGASALLELIGDDLGAVTGSD